MLQVIDYYFCTGIGITFPAVIILLSAIIEPLVAFARVSSAFPNNSLALSLRKTQYKRRKNVLSTEGQLIRGIKPSCLSYIHQAHRLTVKTTQEMATVKFLWNHDSLRLALVRVEKEFSFLSVQVLLQWDHLNWVKLGVSDTYVLSTFWCDVFITHWTQGRHPPLLQERSQLHFHVNPSRSFVAVFFADFPPSIYQRVQDFDQKKIRPHAVVLKTTIKESYKIHD